MSADIVADFFGALLALLIPTIIASIRKTPLRPRLILFTGNLIIGLGFLLTSQYSLWHAGFASLWLFVLMPLAFRRYSETAA